MRLDPLTTVASLLGAIPSATLAFNRLGIVTQGKENRTLQEVCIHAGINIEEFLRVMNEIDWNQECLIEDPNQSDTGR